MKKIFQLFVLASFIFTAANAFSQGFNDVTSPDGIYAIAVGDNGLVFRSSNEGSSWASYTVNGDDYKSVCSVGDDVWFAGENGNVYQTKKANSPINSVNVGAASILNSVFFINSAVGFTCGDGGVLYKSVDGGDTWSPSNTGISSVKLNSISFRDLNNGVVIGDNGTIYTTSNGGTSWSSLASGTTRNLLDVKFFSDGFSVVGEYGTLLMKPDASSLSSVDTKINTDIRGVSGTSMNDVHVCGGGGFVRNNKSANTEFTNFEMNPMMANLVDIHYSDANVGFAVSSLNKAIIKTTNGGDSWSLTAGATASFNWSQKLSGGSGIGNNLCQHPYNRDAMFVMYGDDVYISWDRGDNWTQIATVSGGGRAHSFYVNPIDTNVWVTAITGSPDRVARSTDYGATWTTVVSRNFSNYGQPLEQDPNNPMNYYFAPDGGDFYISTNMGATFTSKPMSFISPCDILVQSGSSNTIFVADGVTGSGNAKIYKTTNTGDNWTLKYTVAASEVPSMCTSIFTPDIIYSTEWSGRKVYRTVNGGDNWSVASDNSGSGWGSDVCHEDPTLVLTGSYGARAWLSVDNGANFESIFTGLSGAGAGIIVPERGYLLNMQTGSLFKLNITYSVVTSVEEVIVSTVAPSKYELYQNYPNPFNPSTKIKYDVPSKGLVKIKIYDQVGREVSELVNQIKNPGSYLIDFDGSSLSSGIYFYKLETAGNTITKKMILVK